MCNGLETLHDKIESFVVFGLSQATGHLMPGNILEVPVRSMQLVLVFRTRSCHRVQRFFQYIHSQ